MQRRRRRPEAIGFERSGLVTLVVREIAFAAICTEATASIRAPIKDPIIFGQRDDPFAVGKIS